MALSEEQARQLAQLEAERDAPEPRTTAGLKGVLHILLDVASGNVPHLATDAWQALHTAVEFYDAEHAGHQQAAAPEAGEQPGAAE
jgi:hypothetical protein